MGQIKKVLTKGKDVVLSAIDASDALEESLTRLNAYPTSMAQLGQAMMGSALLYSLWNEKGLFKKAALHWKVDGPFGDVYTEASEDGSIRGTLANPQAPVDNYQTGLGTGQLVVQKFGNANSTGIIESEGHISNDLLNYLHQSEQRHTSMSLSVKVGWADENKKDQTLEQSAEGKSPFKIEYAYGYLIDVLPHKTKEETEKKLLRWDQYIQNLGPLSQWQINESSPVDGILSILEPQEKNELLYQKIHFNCNCSTERAERALSLSKSEEQNSNEPLEVQCEFCGKKYIFDESN